MIHQKLLNFTYLQCFDCSSVHTMNYCDGSYMCEECYREETENFDNMYFSIYDFAIFLQKTKKNNALELIKLYISEFKNKKEESESEEESESDSKEESKKIDYDIVSVYNDILLNGHKSIFFSDKLDGRRTYFNV